MQTLRHGDKGVFPHVHQVEGSLVVSRLWSPTIFFKIVDVPNQPNPHYNWQGSTLNIYCTCLYQRRFSTNNNFIITSQNSYRVDRESLCLTPTFLFTPQSENQELKFLISRNSYNQYICPTQASSYEIKWLTTVILKVSEGSEMWYFSCFVMCLSKLWSYIHRVEVI